MNLNLIIHGRAGSTLLSEMLIRTKCFHLWGDRSFANELKAFKLPPSWNTAFIEKSLAELPAEGRILAKLPEFAYFLEKLFPFSPSIIVLERSVPERVRSLRAIGWLDRAVMRYEEKGLHKRALKRCPMDYAHLDFEEKAALVLAWGDWRVKYHLLNYIYASHGKVLFINFDNMMLRPHDVYATLDDFFDFPTELYWERWDHIRTKKLQKNNRRGHHGPEAYIKPYAIPVNQQGIARIANRFGAHYNG